MDFIGLSALIHNQAESANGNGKLKPFGIVMDHGGMSHDTPAPVMSNHATQTTSVCVFAYSICVLAPTQISSFSMESFRDAICGASCEASFLVMEQAMTGRDTPQARPRATLLSTNT